jgi:putative tryptophan/tyrosine transport system substrate-binding protein
MRRRAFITLLGGAASWPLAARAQQPAMPVVGFLASYALDQSGERLARAFRDGLKEVGYEEERNVKIEYSSAEGNYNRLPGLAADLVNRRVSVIAAVGGSPAALAAKQATTSVPIVFQVGVDPVQLGIVASLSRPGGNVTGITNLSVELAPKRLELLHELVPAASTIAVLINPSSPVANIQSQEIQAAARAFGLQVHVLHASADRELEAAFAKLQSLGASGLVIGGDPFFNSRSEQLATLASRYAVPAAYQFPEFTTAGGLVSYGSSLVDSHRQTGAYTGRILKGEKPADLPVQQATKVELIINMKTANALGLSVPLPLLGRADEVIE